jgi:hypothetical protein
MPVKKVRLSLLRAALFGAAALLALGAALLAGCSGTNARAGDGADAGGVDAGGADAGGVDAGGTDAGGTDAGGTDAGGDASEGGTSPPPDGAITPAPVRIIRGDPTTTRWLTLTIEGYGIDALEGRLVSVRIGMPDRPPERLGSGQARVEGGAFRITFPDGWEGGLYKRKLAFVDLDADGVCTAADQGYTDYSAAVADTVLTLAGSVPAVPWRLELRPEADPGAFCRLWNEPWPDA